MDILYKLLQPNGSVVNIYYSKGQDKAKILDEVFLPRWEKFCLDNWLNNKSTGTGLTSEDRVKWFLDSCGWFLLREEKDTNVESEYMRIAHSQRSIPVSSCPDYVSDFFYSDDSPPSDESKDERFELILERLDEEGKKKVDLTPKREYPTPRLRKIQTIRDLYPDCGFSFCRVDTDGVFGFNGVQYRVTDERYSPKLTRHGLYYAMDEVIVVTLINGGRLYFTQSLEPIDVQYITTLRDADDF